MKGFTHLLARRAPRRAAPMTRRARLTLTGLEDRVVPAVNPIVTENQLAGTPQSTWGVAGAGDTTIQGFATDISVNHGQTVSFKINSSANKAYKIDIYRMGYYQGNGARLVATIPSTQTVVQVQPAPLTNTATGLVDAGNWSTTASWAVPSTAVSGLYFARVARTDTGGASLIYFVVRDDTGASDLLFQTSDTTWQAYNTWGGYSLYQHIGAGATVTASSPTDPGRAVKVSYNRPLTLDATTGGYGSYNSPLHAEYPMIRWLEANGYNVGYSTDVDTDRRGSELLEHKAFLSVGHDEYWSGGQRAAVEAARDAGVNLAFFSGNESYWKVRWENSVDGSGTPYRTLVTYKESKDNARTDPLDVSNNVWTGTWRDQRFSPPADGGRPENGMTGTLYVADRTTTDLGIPMTVGDQDGQLRFWRNTSVASLAAGQTATLGQFIVGYEVDADQDNGYRPAGLMDMSSTSFSAAEMVTVPWGTEYGPGTVTHKITLYRAPSRALVFGAGTIQWSWGLDGTHNDGTSTASVPMRQATVNLFADMGIQPGSLQTGLVAATASTDVTKPTSTITAPAAGAVFQVGSPVTITGTAADAGGGKVGGVEVSADGGATWHPATGRGTWTYTWIPAAGGAVTLKSRAVDDSGNLETPGAGVGLTVSTANTLVATYSFDAGTGTTLADTSGKGNSGTITNATWTTAGKYGSALSFNGTNALVTIPDANSLDLAGALTLEAWVYPTAIDGWETVVLKEASGDLTYALYADNNGNDVAGAPRRPTLSLRQGANTYMGNGATQVALNTWTHLAATYDGANMRLYVNGSLAGTAARTGPVNVSSNPLRIGGNNVWGEWFSGRIDEVRVYSRALAAGEIQSDMNTPVGAPDTQAPTAPASLTATGSVNSVALSWSAATDNTGIDHYNVYRSTTSGFTPAAGNLVGLAASTTYTDSGLVPGTYFYRVIAADPAGNLSPASPQATGVVTGDISGPTVSVSAPANNTTVSGTVGLTATAADDIGVVGVQFLLDGSNFGAEDTTSPYSASWSTTPADNGPHTLAAVARDAAGHTTSSAAVTVTVSNADATLPTVSLTAPANGATVSGTVTITATASDNVGVVGVQFLLDGNSLGAEDMTAPYSVSWNTAGLPNGTHTLASRARDAAGNATTSAARTVNLLNTDPSQVGQFSAVLASPLVAMNAVLLDTGKILMWDGGPDCLGAVSATVWDPATNTYTPTPAEAVQEFRDIFCSAQTVLADGRILVAGGHECTDPNFVGTAISDIFDPVTQTWTHGPDMADRRWYPTLITLPDGRALVVAGSAHTTLDYDPIPEVYDPVTNTWTKLTGASKTIPNYPYVFQLPDGRVLVAGSDEAKMGTYALDVAAQTWTTVDPTVLDAGSAVMYAPGKIMKAGSSYLSAPADNGGNTPSAATTYVLDTTQGTPAWQQTASMAYPRTHLNLTVLPDGTVLATGGSSVIGGIDPATGVLPAELWNPTTKTWTTMASLSRAREYHSTALLLPDGRVMVSGSGHNFANNYAEQSSEIYSPPYLFKGARPTVTSSPGDLAYGASFFVGTPDGAGIASVSLVRNGSVTHSFNMDQQLVPLSFTQTTGGLTVRAPADALTAPPGYYMLFVVNSNGVPSVAPIVRLLGDSQPPTAPTALTAAGSTGSVNLAWTAATDNVGVHHYSVYRSTSPGFTPSAATKIGQATGTTYTDAGLAPGTYYYAVTAADAVGNVSPASAQAGASATGDTTAPTVSIASPTAGTTVTGTVTVSASASDNVGVAGVQFKLDGANLGAEDAASPYSVNWATTGATNGTHTLTAVARDAAGNTTASTAVTVTVNNTAIAGLVGAWGFEEGTGTTTADVSGHALAGTLANAAWTPSGKYGNALSFNGTNAWVTVADNALLHLTNGMTVEAWVKPAAASTDWAAAVLKERGTTGLAYALYATDGANKPPAGYINRSGTDVEAAGATVLALNAWSHLAVTYDGTTIRLYVNGTQAGTKAQTGNINSSTAPLRFGGDSVWGEYFNGLIDEVRVYSTALTAAQIATDMNTPVGGGTGAQLADRPAVASTPRTAVLADDGLMSALGAALDLWQAAGVPAVVVPAARTVSVHIADLPGSGLGFTDVPTGQIWLDRDAAGYGWGAGGYDLDTVLAHEVGHLLGVADFVPDVDQAADLMDQTLAPSEVRTPSPLDVRLALGSGRSGDPIPAATAGPDRGPLLSALSDTLSVPAPGGLAAGPDSFVRMDQESDRGEDRFVAVEQPALVYRVVPAPVGWPAEGDEKEWWTAEPLLPDPWSE
jgi:N,N-dimethylformamidase beta subunit-like, C-terminal/Concanavalin A-like lectin/glucanases superfamily/Galactose oxidase-like, Early set domain/Bacterial Ig domain/Glyoxal oxidase N-terminus